MAGEQHSAAFEFGDKARVGDISVSGSVVGRDQVITNQDPDAAVFDRAQLLAALDDLQRQVSELQDAPRGVQQDAADELAKASQAGEAKDDERLVEKLETAKGYLERIGASLPAALAVAQTIATLVQRVPGLH
jgi:hypothetical protein